MRASGSVAIVTPLAQMEVECKTSRNLGGRRPLRPGSHVLLVFYSLACLAFCHALVNSLGELATCSCW